MTVSTRALAPGVLRNAASATATQPDADPGDNAASATARAVEGRTRITVSKRANHARVAAGGRITYWITVRDRGGLPARRLEVCDHLPEPLGLVSAPGGRLRRGSVCWTLRTLRAGGQRRFRLVARAANGPNTSAITNTVAARARNARRETARARLRVLGAQARGGGVTG